MGLRISGDGTKLMLTASGAYVHRIDPATDAIVDTVNTGVLTADLAWSDARDALLIAGPLGSDGLFIVSLSQKGDLNCDGVVDTGDVAPFVLALLDPAGYAAQYPDCDVSRADVNVSGTADGLDIQPFVDLLLAP